jgi:integrase
MSSTKGPAKRTRTLNGRHYLVRAEGKKRIWVPLTKVSEGLPAFYAALAEQLKAPTVADDLMPKVIAAWEAEVMPPHAETTQRDERARGKVIAERFEDFRARDVQSTDVAEFLAAYTLKAKTHNFYRAQISELMRFAMLKGWREPGTNPVRDIIRTLKTPPRDRYPTDSEVRRIKVAGIYATVRADAPPGAKRQKNRSGLMLAALIDMAYLTGQRISDLLRLEWSQIGRDGILFKPGKTSKSTGASVLIGWTPKLEAVVARLKALRAGRRAFGTWVFTKQAAKKGMATPGQRYTYSGAHSAWVRACERAGIEDCRFNDMRAKALTDDEELHGMQSARRKGAHSTEQQTTTYIRHKKPQQSKATR